MFNITNTQRAIYECTLIRVKKTTTEFIFRFIDTLRASNKTNIVNLFVEQFNHTATVYVETFYGREYLIVLIFPLYFSIFHRHVSFAAIFHILVAIFMMLSYMTSCANGRFCKFCNWCPTLKFHPSIWSQNWNAGTKFEPRLRSKVGFYKLQMESVKTKKATKIGGLQAVINRYVCFRTIGLFTHATKFIISDYQLVIDMGHLKKCVDSLLQ